MQAEKLIFNNCRKREIIKELCKAFPDIGVTILSTTFVIEAVYLGNLPGFVIASQNCDPVFVPNLECDEQGDCFDAVMA